MRTITRAVTLFCGTKVNVRFVIKPEERKVVAFTDSKTCESKYYLTDIVVALISKHWYHSGIILVAEGNTNIYKQLHLNSSYKAVATCHEDDTWDEETGIRIAREKITDKLNKAVKRRLIAFIDLMDSTEKSFVKKYFG